VDDALMRAFGARHGTIEGPYPWTTVSPERLGQFILDHPQFDAVSSHQARLPLPRLANTTFVPLLFLRHPIDRFGSVYQYERKDAKDSLSPSAAIAQSGDLRAFAEWTVSPQATAVVRNYQTNHVAGIDHDMREVSANGFHLAIARKRLAALPLVGVVDRFDQSMARFSEFICAAFPHFSGSYEIQNVSQGRTGTLDERLDAIRQQLGDPLYQRLADLNRLDLALYQDACRRLEQ
jgi:hypothetical protein